MIIQFCGLSGSGKTTLAGNIKQALKQKNIDVEVIDGDEYRKVLCADLGFSKADRNQNIRRLAFVAGKLAQYKVVPIICAINPYNDIREEISATYENVKTVFIDCALDVLMKRDTKGLYIKALLPDGHPEIQAAKVQTLPQKRTPLVYYKSIEAFIESVKFYACTPLRKN